MHARPVIAPLGWNAGAEVEAAGDGRDTGIGDAAPGIDGRLRVDDGVPSRRYDKLQPARRIGAIEQAVNGERLLGWPGLLDPEAAEKRKVLAAGLAGVDGEGAGRHAEDLSGAYCPEVRCAEEIQEIFEDVRFLKLPEGAESGKVRLRGRFRRAGGRLELEGIGRVRDLDRLRALNRVNANGIGIEGAGGMVRLKRERHPVLGPNRLVLLIEDRALVLVERQVCQCFVDALLERLIGLVAQLAGEAVKPVLREWHGGHVPLRECRNRKCGRGCGGSGEL